jgi:hypothetical protein
VNETVVRSLSARRKAIILVSCCLSLLIVSMDATIVNVAIPNGVFPMDETGWF